MVQLVFYVCVSLALLVVDLRFHMLEWVRQSVHTVAIPCNSWLMRPYKASKKVAAI